MEIGHVKTRLNCMLSAATSCSSRLHHCPRLARFVLAFKSSLLYSSKPFMNIPSVPGGNGPIFDTSYCRRKILQNLVRGIGWLASAKFGPTPPTPPSLRAGAPPPKKTNTGQNQKRLLLT